MFSRNQGNLEIDSERIRKLFSEIGLYSPKQEFYSERIRKYSQVFAFVTQIETALKRLSSKRTVVMLDYGCGRSYLSLILCEYCNKVLSRNIKIIGVDTNADLINKCRKTAEELEFNNMEFYHAKVEEFRLTGSIDVVYSLHACNTATDQAISVGIKFDASYIFSVSCCQHDNRGKISKHPLKSITRHYPYKERLVDMIGDSMRGLILEHYGYKIKLFEFVAAEHTPKNIMLRAVKNSVKKKEKQEAMNKYRDLVNMFNFSIALEDMLDA